MPPSLVNPQSLSLLNRASYLTISEFKAAPTALDLSNLVSGGTEADQDTSLAEIIARASSAIDQFCFPDGTGGTLAAATVTDTASARVNKDGLLPLICRFKPVIEILSVSVGPTPTRLTAVSAEALADAFVGESMRVIYVPPYGSNREVFSPMIGPRTRLRAQWSYVPGYPHTILGDDAPVASTSLVVGSTLGMLPGTSLTIYDGADAETVVVDEVVSATEISLVSATRYAHTAPEFPDAISVSALPGSVKQAAIYIVSSFIKDRGDNAFVLPDSGPVGSPEVSTSGASDSEVKMAMELLRPFRVFAGRAS